MKVQMERLVNVMIYVIRGRQPLKNENYEYVCEAARTGQRTINVLVKRHDSVLAI